jgi:hypothetical protein
MMTHGLEAQNRARVANNGEAQQVHIAHMTDNIWDAGTAHSELNSVLMTQHQWDAGTNLRSFLGTREKILFT